MKAVGPIALMKTQMVQFQGRPMFSADVASLTAQQTQSIVQRQQQTQVPLIHPRNVTPKTLDARSVSPSTQSDNMSLYARSALSKYLDMQSVAPLSRN